MLNFAFKNAFSSLVPDLEEEFSRIKLFLLYEFRHLLTEPEENGTPVVCRVCVADTDDFVEFIQTDVLRSVVDELLSTVIFRFRVKSVTVVSFPPVIDFFFGEVLRNLFGEVCVDFALGTLGHFLHDFFPDLVFDLGIYHPISSYRGGPYLDLIRRALIDLYGRRFRWRCHNLKRLNSNLNNKK